MSHQILFFDGGYYLQEANVLRHVEKMLSDGADIIDIGGLSTRPGAKPVSEKEEKARVIPFITAIRKSFPNALLSIDTYRANVAKAALDLGAHMINDVSGGEMDGKLIAVIAQYPVPYVLMHMQGTPENMQVNPQYKDVLTDITNYFISKIEILDKEGIKDIILDPGFGFGKTLEHNYQLLANLHCFKIFNLPILVGLSRKGMIYKPLHTNAQNALTGTIAANTVALMNGAKMLRVHDVKEAAQTIKIVSRL